ncbi:chromosome condensation complex Condensin, subunit G [Pleurotus ostreatus]|nr:chromosome condensation complex Condensin, subunit G [Pleurotus ostreatus]
MPARTVNGDDAPLADKFLPHVKHIFSEVQDTTGNHQKNYTHLYKVHQEAAKHVERVKKGKRYIVKYVGENQFEDAFFNLVVKSLALKKGVKQADNIAKFVGGYVKHANEKASELKMEDDEDADDDTTASRFTASLLGHLLEGFEAKDKTVRYRVLQIITEMVAHLGELDVDDYQKLHTALRARVNDRESSVRMQAIIALSRLVDSEDPDEIPDGELSGSDMILQAISGDASAEVRRAALLNTPVTEKTLPVILDRMRDVDPTVRKMVFANVLATNITQRVQTEEGEEEEVMGPTHPKAMKISERELIVQNGLGDREVGVRSVAAKLLSSWVDAVTPQGPVEIKQDESQQMELPAKTESGDVPLDKEVKKSKLQEGVLNVIGLFDLGGESEVPRDALLSIFETRPEIINELNFTEDEYWANATSESAFLARVFSDFCLKKNDLGRRDNMLPVVTAMAFHISTTYHALQDILASLRASNSDEAVFDVDAGLTDEERAKMEDDLTDKEFVMTEMLKLALDLDYADELGRRKMFALVRDLMQERTLPVTLLEPCLDLLRQLSNGESDLIRMVSETINDLRYAPDHEVDEPPPEDTSSDFDATPATVKPQRTAVFSNKQDLIAKTQEEADEIDLRCLHLCTGMLERVNGTLENHSTLDGVLKGLIIPSVRRTDMIFRLQGLTSLGLCCLISPRLAGDSYPFFKARFLEPTPISLKIRLAEIIFDIVMVNERELLATDANREELAELMLQGLGNDFGRGQGRDHEDGEAEAKKLQAVIAKGLAKLILAGMITDKNVLCQLFNCYFSSDTVDNQDLRQCLTYFFPMYSYSKSENQHNMRKVFIPTMENREHAAEEEPVPAAQIVSMFVDMTDPLKVLEVAGKDIDEDVHLDLAADIIKVILDGKTELSRESKKAMCQALPKLYLPEEADQSKLRGLRLLIHSLIKRRPVNDVSAKNAAAKFETAFCKKYEQLEGFSEAEYRQYGELKDLFDFLDDLIPLSGDEEDADLKPPKGKKRRSGSVVSVSTDGEMVSGATSRSSRSGQGKAKKPRFSQSDIESDEEDLRRAVTPPPRPARPKRAAALHPKAPQVVVISSDSDEDATPVPRRRSQSSRSSVPQVKEEAEEMDVIVDDILGGSVPGHDSIMDNSSADEDEVNDLVFPSGDD